MENSQNVWHVNCKRWGKKPILQVFDAYHSSDNQDKIVIYQWADKIVPFVVFPVKVIIYLLTSSIKQTSDENYCKSKVLEHKYGSVFEGMKVKQVGNVFGYHYFQMIRAILVALSVVYMGKMLFA